MSQSALVTLFALGVAGIAYAGSSITRINSGIRVEAHQQVGDLDTVNGGIRVGAHAVAADVETVNGGVRLAEGARAESVATVNGGVSLQPQATVTGDIETVNGGVAMDPGSAAGGHVGNVNGHIRVRGARIEKGISTVSGDITLSAGAKVAGGIRVEKPLGMSWGTPRIPRVVIGRDCQVDGPLVFEREVALWVHRQARIGAITGAKAQPFDGESPPL